MENMLGKTVDHYQILDKFPEGGMGVVYGAFDTRLERSVAIKFIRTDKIAPSDLEHLLKRFEREAKVLARFDHPNIVTIYDYGEYQDHPYLVMQYLPGGSLKSLAGKKMSWKNALQIASQIASGLSYAHKTGVLHRDIKPGNILLTKEGKIKITDFGIARILESEDNTQLTATGMGIGTPDYMSPEQCMGLEANPQSDIYALGVVLYELLTGTRPFTADTPMAVMIKQVHDPLPDPRTYVPDLPQELYDLLLKALAKDPAQRYEDMHTFEKELLRLLDEDLQPYVLEMKTQEKQQDEPHDVVSNQDALEPVNGTTTMPAPMDIETSVDIEPLYADQQTEIMPSTEQVPESIEHHHSPRRKWLIWVTIFLVLGLLAAVLALSGALNPYLAKLKIQKYTNPIDGSVQVFVTAGEFNMGSDNGKQDEQPLHTVFLDSFWIDRYEVTNSQYANCVAAGFCDEPVETNSILRSDYYDVADFADFPVIYVSWQDATNYCLWAGKQLPTEAQWEKAARGGQIQSLYPWGNKPADCNLANINKCYGDTSAVGSYSAGVNPYGVFDMAGNVAEWVADWYRVDSYSNSTQSNPVGPEDGFKKVIRGGSWYSNPDQVQLSARDSNYPDFHGPMVGFRCVAAIP